MPALEVGIFGGAKVLMLVKSAFANFLVERRIPLHVSLLSFACPFSNILSHKLLQGLVFAFAGPSEQLCWWYFKCEGVCSVAEPWQLLPARP